MTKIAHQPSGLGGKKRVNLTHRRQTGGPVSTLLVFLALLTSASGGDAAKEGSDKKTRIKIGEIRIVIGRWCRQTYGIKAGDTVYIDDTITYCGSPLKPTDRLVIRFRIGGPDGQFEDRPYECATPGVCDVPTNLTLPPPPSKSAPERDILISSPDLIGANGSVCLVAVVCSTGAAMPLVADLPSAGGQVSGFPLTTITWVPSQVRQSIIVSLQGDTCFNTVTVVYRYASPPIADPSTQEIAPCAAASHPASTSHPMMQAGYGIVHFLPVEAQPDLLVNVTIGAPTPCALKPTVPPNRTTDTKK